MDDPDICVYVCKCLCKFSMWPLWMNLVFLPGGAVFYTPVTHYHPPTPLSPRGVSTLLLMQSSISGEGLASTVWAQRGGKSAIHVMLMRPVIVGDKVPLGDTGPITSGDQHAAAVREKDRWQGREC